MSSIKRREWLRGSLAALGMAPFFSMQSWTTTRVTGFAEEFAIDWGRAGEYTIEVADAMPGEKYDFKPAEGMRNFGELMFHIAQGGYLWPALLIGSKEWPAEAKPDGDFSKEKLMSLLPKSFENAKQIVAGLGDDVLNEEKNLFNGFLVGPKWKVCQFMLDHVTHHRGYALPYVRMQGITPPRYRFGTSKLAP